MTLLRYFDEVYRPLKLRGRSANTTRLYGCTIRSFGKFLGRSANLADIADELTLARYLEHRQTTRSPYTAEKERSQLIAMAKLANERRMIDRMPTCDPCVLPDRMPMAWSEDELHRLYQAASATRGHIGAMKAGDWWPLLIDVSFQTGERIGAILAVSVRDYRRPFLTFTAETRKGGRRSRLSELSEDLCDRIDAMLKLTGRTGAETLFHWPKSYTYLWDGLRKIKDRAGLSGKRLGFQQVRRSAISHFAKAGGDPVSFAGHAQASTTKRWYLDPRFVDRGPRPADLLPRLSQKLDSSPPGLQ